MLLLKHRSAKQQQLLLWHDPSRGGAQLYPARRLGGSGDELSCLLNMNAQLLVQLRKPIQLAGCVGNYKVSNRRMTHSRAEPHQDLERVLFSAEQIAGRIAEVGR